MRPAPLVFVAWSCWSVLAHAQDPGLTTGGLAPPPAVEGQGGESADGAAGTAGDAPVPEQSLAQADREDSGRGLEFVWLNGEIGITHVGLRTISDSNIAVPGVVKTRATGPVVGAGLGLRIIFFTVGARFRFAPVKHAFDHWTLGGEGAVHFPFGALEPYGGVGVGYASFKQVRIANLDSVIPEPAPNDPSGLDVRLFGGADYYLTSIFSVGANVSGDLLLLWRKATPGASPTSVESVSGKSVGAAVTATAVAGLHF
jgi:hypothetical protein